MRSAEVDAEWRLLGGRDSTPKKCDDWRQDIALLFGSAAEPNPESGRLP